MKIYNGRLTKNFRLYEFSHLGEHVHIDEHFIPFVLLLQKFRDWYNRPINITSGYRPPDYNDQIGGSPNSAHLFTRAVDFGIPLKEFESFSQERKNEFYSNVLQKWAELCQDAGYYYQCNWYDTYLHLGISCHENSFIDERRKNK